MSRLYAAEKLCHRQNHAVTPERRPVAINVLARAVNAEGVTNICARRHFPRRPPFRRPPAPRQIPASLKADARMEAMPPLPFMSYRRGRVSRGCVAWLECLQRRGRLFLPHASSLRRLPSFSSLPPFAVQFRRHAATRQPSPLSPTLWEASRNT